MRKPKAAVDFPRLSGMEAPGTGVGGSHLHTLLAQVGESGISSMSTTLGHSALHYYPQVLECRRAGQVWVGALRAPLHEIMSPPGPQLALLSFSSQPLPAGRQDPSGPFTR